MKQSIRTSLRATGQIGLLAAAVNTAVSTATGVIHHIRYFGIALPDQGLGLFLFFFADAAAMVVVAVFAFWASTRPDHNPGNRRMAIIASWLSVSTGMLQIAIYGGGLPSPLSLLLVQVTVEMLWPIGAGVCLALSYLGQPLGLGEPDALRPRSPWIRMIAAPAIGINLAIMWLQRYTHFPEASVVAVLAVGLLYGLMRRRHPLPGAAGWAAATWPLTALVIPIYALDMAVAASADDEVGRPSVAAAVAVVILIGVVVVHRVSQRRPEGHEVEISFGTWLRP